MDAISRDLRNLLETFVAIANVQANHGDVAGAIKTAGIETKGICNPYRGPVLFRLAEEQIKAGHLAVAMDLARKMGLKTRAYLVAEIVEVHVRRGELDRAKQLVSEQYWNNPYAPDALAVAQAEAGDYDGAVQSAKPTACPGCTLSKILEVYARKQSVAKALHLALLHEPRPSLSPLRPLFGAIHPYGRATYPVSWILRERRLLDQATAECEAGDLSAALATLAKFETCGDAYGCIDGDILRGALFAIAKGRARAGDFAEAQAMGAHVLQTQGQVQHLLVAAALERGEFAQAERWASGWGDPFWKQVVEARLRRGEISEALQAARRIRSVPEERLAVSTVVARQVASRDFRGALEALQSARPLPDRVDFLMLRTLALGLIETGDAGLAEEMRNLFDPGIKAAALSAEIDVMLHIAGHPRKLSVATLESIFPVDPGFPADIAAASASAGDTEAIQRLTGLAWGPRDQALVLIGIAEGLGHAADRRASSVERNSE